MESPEMLERLASNPHYKMTPRQLQALRQLRGIKEVQHTASFQTHPTGFDTHPTDPLKQANDETL